MEKQLTENQKAHIRSIILMKRTIAILEKLIQPISQETATTLRDEGDGWTVTEVICHLRDFNEIFHQRAIMFLEEDNPALPAYDHDAMAIERDYNSQNLQNVFAELQQSRDEIMAFFNELSDEQWEQVAIHPEKGRVNLGDAAAQVGFHDLTHIDQIHKILNQ